jgi:hypothetical protein
MNFIEVNNSRINSSVDENKISFTLRHVDRIIIIDFSGELTNLFCRVLKPKRNWRRHVLPIRWSILTTHHEVNFWTT